MNKLSLIKEKFNQDVIEPIFDYELYELGITDEDIEDTLEEKVFERVETDLVPCKVFTLVLYAELFDLYSKYEGTEDDIVYKYYIGKNNEYGYVTGFAALNGLRLSNQTVFSGYEIKSIRTDREITVKNMLILPIKYKDDRTFVLEAYLEAFKKYSNYFDIKYTEALNIVRKKLSNSEYELFLEELNK